MKVLTIGTATRDVIVSSRLFKIVHDPVHLKRLGFPTGEAQCFALGGKIEIEEPIFALGGGAANSAVTFARQGFITGSLIKIGKDQNGKEILESLRKEKVRVVPIFDSRRGTAYSVILISPDGERTILNYRGASRDLLLSEIPRREFRADSVYVVPGAIGVPVIASIISKLKRRGALIAMNPSGHYLKLGIKKLRPIFDNLDIIILNREEASTLTGKKYEDEKGIFKKFDELVRGLAVMTDGPKGVMVSDGRRIYKAGIYKEKRVADRTGAGDSFGSGFVAGLLQASGNRYSLSSTGQREFREDDIIKGIKLGSANATSNVEKIGAQTGILTRSEFVKDKRWRKLPIKIYKI